MIEFHVNNEPVSFSGDEDTPLLWILRDHLKLLNKNPDPGDADSFSAAKQDHKCI